MVAATGGAIVCLPWMIASSSCIKKIAQENVISMSAAGAHLSFPALLANYLLSFPPSMSLLLFTLFAASSLLALRRLGQLVPLVLSAVGGVVLLSCLTWTFPLDRYASTALIACAAISGLGVSQLVGANQIPRLASVSLLILLAAAVCLQDLSFAFSPYPLRQLRLAGLAPIFDVSLREFRGVTITGSCPLVADWGQGWAIDAIDSTDRNKPFWLNILPSSGIYNPHTFQLIARERGSSIKPTTSRGWTITGDQVKFSPDSALWYQWYLLKTGAQGNQLADADSEKAYRQLTDFVTNSGRFHLVAQRPVPDGSTIALYRQN
jgi:hypothetical protein